MQQGAKEKAGRFTPPFEPCQAESDFLQALPYDHLGYALLREEATSSDLPGPSIG